MEGLRPDEEVFSAEWEREGKGEIATRESSNFRVIVPSGKRHGPVVPVVTDLIPAGVKGGVSKDTAGRLWTDRDRIIAVRHRGDFRQGAVVDELFVSDCRHRHGTKLLCCRAGCSSSGAVLSGSKRTSCGVPLGLM